MVVEIFRAVRDGARTLEEISETTGIIDLSPYNCADYLSVYRSVDPKLRMALLTELVIRDLMKEKERSVREISKLLDVKQYRVNKVLKLAGLNFRKRHEKREVILTRAERWSALKTQIMGEIEKGNNTYPALANVLGRGYGTVVNWIKRLGLKSSLQRSRYSNQLVDDDAFLDIITDPNNYFTLKEAGDKLGISKERVRQKLIRLGQEGYFCWKRETRDRPLERDTERSKLVKVLNAFLDGKKSALSWEEQMAFNYLNSLTQVNRNPDRTYSFEKLVEMFSHYKRTLDSGRNLSYNKFSEEIKISPMGVRRILRRVGLKGFNWEMDYRPRINEHERAAVQRGLETAFSPRDLAHFLDRPALTHSLKRKPKKRIYVSLSSISQVYEAIDAGFNVGESIELLGVNQRTVDYALRNRANFERILIENLRILYNNPAIDRPYVNVSEKVAELRKKG